MKVYHVAVLAAAIAVGLAVPAANATPFTVGSFSISTNTDTTSDVTTTTSFHIDSLVPIAFGATGDFTDAGVTFPSALNASTTIDFAAVTGFDFSFSDFGSFTATSAHLAQTTPAPNGSATWNVIGTFTVGSFWDNAGTILSASETWTCNQTGGAGNSISCGGTFNAPSAIRNIPEPLTLSLFGTGLVGAAALRRRKTRKV